MFKKHTPNHIFADDTPYFITGAIYKKRPLLIKEQLKYQLLALFQGYFAKHNWELHHWVILDNHYHILGKSHAGRDLIRIMRNVHRVMAYKIVDATDCQTPVWWNYWDYCPRNEQDYRIRLNYLLNNPVKHGYVSNLYDYPYSSFHQVITTQGKATLHQQFRDYPEFRTLVLREAYDDDF